MLFTGYVVKVDFEPINELVSLTAHLSNNINQLAKKANNYEEIRSEDIQEVRELTQSINDTNKELLEKNREAVKGLPSFLGILSNKNQNRK